MTDEENARAREMDVRLRQEGQALRETREGCPDPDLLMARGSEVLDEALRRRLDEHVRACEACRRLVDDLDHCNAANIALAKFNSRRMKACLDLLKVAAI